MPYLAGTGSSAASQIHFELCPYRGRAVVLHILMASWKDYSVLFKYIYIYIFFTSAGKITTNTFSPCSFPLRKLNHRCENQTNLIEKTQIHLIFWPCPLLCVIRLLMSSLTVNILYTYLLYIPMGILLCNLLRWGYRLWWLKNEAVYWNWKHFIRRPDYQKNCLHCSSFSNDASDQDKCLRLVCCFYFFFSVPSSFYATDKTLSLLPKPSYFTSFSSDNLEHPDGLVM